MFKFDDFHRRAESSLLQTPAATWSRSDDDMNQKAKMIPEGQTPKRAAVLVPIILHDVPTVLLTTRHASLSSHAGQIAFPGGRLEVGESPLEAALREAQEEVGLDPASFQPLGYLDCYLTITNYLVTPVVALRAAGFETSLQRGEVDNAFEVPLAFLMDLKNCQTHSRERDGLSRKYYVYQYGPHHIWGATAGMIRNLHDRLYA